MPQGLDAIADLLTPGSRDAGTLDGYAGRCQHTAAVRAALAERHPLAPANKMLLALRGVLRKAWWLGYLDPETYHRAWDLRAIQVETRPRGRALASGELRMLFAVCAEDPDPSGPREMPSNRTRPCNLPLRSSDRQLE